MRGLHDEAAWLPLFSLVKLTCAFAGLQFGWAIQIAYSTPIFLELGMSHAWVSWVWLAGPVSGLLVQPLVGAISDDCSSSWGKRKPFIAFGALGVVVGMSLVSRAKLAARAASILLGYDVGESPSSTLTIAFAVVGFWILDVSNNAVMSPCRALLVDSTPRSQQAQANAVLSFMLGVGNTAGYVVGSIPNITSYAPWSVFFTEPVEALFTSAMVFLVVCTCVTLFSAFPARRDQASNGSEESRGAFGGFSSLTTMGSELWRICTIQFFSWTGWFCVFLYYTDWMGEVIYGGKSTDGGDEQFHAGVRAGSAGLALSSVVAVLVSIALPRLISRFGVKTLYASGQLVLAGCLFLPGLVSSKALAVAVIALTGVPWAVTMVVPFTLVGQMQVAGTGPGVNLGILNVSVVIPQLLVALFMGPVVEYTGSATAALVISGAFVCTSLWWIMRLETPKPQRLPQRM